MKQDLVVHGLSETTMKRLMKMKEEANYGQKDWAEYFAFVSKDVKLNDLQSEMIQQNTRDNLLEVWVQNLGHNLPSIWSGKSIADLVPEEVRRLDAEGKDPDVIQGTAVVVGRGPSIFKHKHMEMLAKSDYHGVVVCTDGGLIDLLKAGVQPDRYEGFYVVTVDGNREKIWKWYDDPLVDKYGSSIKAVLCSSAAPNVVERCKKAGIEVYWFHPLFDDYRQIESFTKMQSLITKKHTVQDINDEKLQRPFAEHLPNGVANMQAGGHAGGCAWVLAWVVLRRSPVALIGIDLGYLPETPLESTYYWDALMQQTGGNAGLVQLAYTKVHNPDFDVDATVDPVFQHYRQSMFELVKATPPWVDTWNCTEGGSLFGEGIRGRPFSEFLEKFKK